MINAIVLNAGLARHDGDWNWKNVRSPFARIYYVLEGNAEIVFEDRVCRLSAGKLYLVPPFVQHSNRCTGPFVHYYAHVYETTDTTSGLFEDYAFPDSVAATALDKDLFARLCQINSNKKLPDSNPTSYDNPDKLRQSVIDNRIGSRSVKMESSGIVNQLMSRFMSQAKAADSGSDSRVMMTMRHIRQNLHDSISIDTLAGLCCLSKDHFIRLFKSSCGMTPLQYINHRRIEYAETMLITSNFSVKEIAAKSGFKDSSYFTRLFKKHTGVTPQTYREIAGSTTAL